MQPLQWTPTKVGVALMRPLQPSMGMTNKVGVALMRGGEGCVAFVQWNA